MGGGAARKMNKSASTASAPSYTIDWESPKLNLYDGYDLKNFYTALPTECREAGEPLLIYLTTSAPDAQKRVDELEQNLSQDESVALSSRLFHPIRLKGDSVTKEHQYWSLLGGKELPRIVVVSTDGTKVASFDGKQATGSAIFAAMKRAAAKTYKTSLETVVKQRRDLLDEMDRVTAKLGVIAEQKKVATSAAKAKELDDQSAKLTKELAAVQAREADLLKKVGDEKKVAKS
jgi:hypothetical protein